MTPQSAPSSSSSWWRDLFDLKTVMAVISFGMSAVAFYRSNLYVKDDLELSVNEISYQTNAAGLYMTMSLANLGNRDAQVLRVRPLLWAQQGNHEGWRPLNDPVDTAIRPNRPEPPFTVRAASFEGVRLSAALDPAEAEHHVEPIDPSFEAIYLGIEIAAVDGGGATSMVQIPVTRLQLDREGRILAAQPTIHRTLNVLQDIAGVPPGDQLIVNKHTPFVWADQHYRP